MKKIILFAFVALATNVKAQWPDSSKTVIARESLVDWLQVSSFPSGFANDSIWGLTFEGQNYIRKDLRSGMVDAQSVRVFANGSDMTARINRVLSHPKVRGLVLDQSGGGDFTINGTIVGRGKIIRFAPGCKFIGTGKPEDFTVQAGRDQYIFAKTLTMGAWVRPATGWYSIRWWGAHPDSAALWNGQVFKYIGDFTEMNGGGQIEYPAGHYWTKRIGTQMILAESNTQHIGDGDSTWLQLDTADVYNFRRMFYVGTDRRHVKIAKMRLTGSNKIRNSDSIQYQFQGEPGVPAYDAQNAAVFSYSSDSTKPVFDLVVEDLLCEDWTGDIIGFSRNTHRATARRVRFKNRVRQGIGLGGGDVDDVLIEKCVDLGNDYVYKASGHSIHCEPYSAQRNVKYIDNDIFDFSASGIVSGEITGNIVRGNNLNPCNGVTDFIISKNQLLNGSRLQVSTYSQGNVTIADNMNLSGGIVVTAVADGSGFPNNPIVIKNNFITALNNNGIDNAVDGTIIDNNRIKAKRGHGVYSSNKNVVVINNKIDVDSTGNFANIYSAATVASNYGMGMDFIDNNWGKGIWRFIYIGNKSAIIGPNNRGEAPQPYHISTAKIFPYRTANGTQYLRFQGTTLPNYHVWGEDDIVETSATTPGSVKKWQCYSAGALVNAPWSAAGTYYRNYYVSDTVTTSPLVIRYYKAVRSGGHAERPRVDTDTSFWEQVATTAAKFRPIELVGQFYSGTGNPEGVQAASVGAFYIRTDGPIDSALWRKNTGTETITGWGVFRSGSTISAPNGRILFGTGSGFSTSANLLWNSGVESIFLPALPSTTSNDSVLTAVNGVIYKKPNPASGSSGITSLNLLTNGTQTFGTPNIGASSAFWSSSGSSHTLNLPLSKIARDSALAAAERMAAANDTIKYTNKGTGIKLFNAFTSKHTWIPSVKGAGGITASLGADSSLVIDGSDISGGGINELTGDVTAAGVGGVTATISNNAITYAKFQQMAGLSVLGRSANSTGNAAAITAGSDYQVMRRSGTTLGFGAIDLSQAGAVGSSVLKIANGGTGLSSLGSAMQGLRVNASGTAVEFYTPSGIFTPTVINSANITSTSGRNLIYSRNGNVVTVSGLITAVPTAANVTTYLEIDLPFTTAFTNGAQALGSGVNIYSDLPVQVQSVGSTGTVRVQWKMGTVGVGLGNGLLFNFQFIVQ